MVLHFRLGAERLIDAVLLEFGGGWGLKASPNSVRQGKARGVKGAE